MASDVTEQVFNEKQLFTGDVRGEDEDDETVALALSIPTPSATSAASGAAASSSQAVAPPKGESARERRRKKAAERATKIVFWLETKYDILPEVCSSIENWKEAPSASSDFDLFWYDTAIPADRFMELKLYQKMNHFVGMSAITRKNNLGRNLLRMRKQFPKEYKFFPDTWILPTDLSDFKMQFSSSKNKTFIVKPDNGCQGKGIFLVRDVEKVPVDFSTTYVAQRYIHRPFLLDGFKFDLRLYVLVLGCDPLRIFLHKRGLVRLASEPYVEPSGKNIQQTMVHLTNYAVNKMNPNFEENINPDDGSDGHKRSWEAVQEQLRKDGHDVTTLNAEIEDLIIKTLLAVQPSLSHFYHSCQPEDIENSMCFEILGFDVMLDQKMQPWLLEVNHAPSFAAESELDKVVKTQVLRDTFALLNMCPENRRQKKREAREKMEQRAMGVAKKTTMEERAVLEQEMARTRTAWEDEQPTGYKRLYGTEQQEREYMPIHDAAINIWEMLMGGTSRRSVRLLPQASPPEDGRGADADGKGEKGARKNNQAKKAESSASADDKKEKRTPEQVREVVERLMAGCSAFPRANEGARRREESTGPHGEGAHLDDDPDRLQAEDEELAPTTTQVSGSRSRTEVQVGDIIKVQTNLGWEGVTVRAKRPNGKVDIQFKDGEYMRAVLPRILRDQSQPSGQSGERERPRSSSKTSARASDAPLVPPVPPRASTPGNSQGGPLIEGSVRAAAPSNAEVQEAMETFNSHLSAQLQPARTRRRSGTDSRLDQTVSVVPPQLGAPGGMAGRGTCRSVRRGSSNVSSPPAAPNSGVTQANLNRYHELRLRQQLQQLISVRPIVNRRA